SWGRPDEGRVVDLDGLECALGGQAPVSLEPGNSAADLLLGCARHGERDKDVDLGARPGDRSRAGEPHRSGEESVLDVEVVPGAAPAAPMEHLRKPEQCCRCRHVVCLPGTEETWRN